MYNINRRFEKTSEYNILNRVIDTKRPYVPLVCFLMEKYLFILEYSQDNNSWIDNFIYLLMELEKQSKDLRKKAYHKLMRGVFNTKIFYEASTLIYIGSTNNV
ncbi:hypothetical protein Glove_363g40 [Diversispora epigaea]|uniref:Uncharacterized protein n=1 Tax=Diversispora epigaea TaxID=1348612 RepID=A0A397H920_9GLOM|nr:hypothetical protein Glove_363g40 [Diversispora epigaea]